MITKKIQTSVRIQERTYQKLKVLAEKEHRSFNNFIVYILQNYSDDYEHKNGPIQVSDNSAK